MTQGKGASVPDQALVASDGAASVSTLSGFDPSRVEAKVSSPSGYARTVSAIRVGRLLVHPALDLTGRYNVTHAGTGGIVVHAPSEKQAIKLAQILERDHSDGLDILDSVKWGKNLTVKMRARPAIRRLAEFRAIAIEAAAAGETAKTGSTVGESAGPTGIAQPQP